MVELRVADRMAVVAWYRDAIGLAVILDDPSGNFSLLDAGPIRLAIKGGREGADPGSVALIFRVDDVTAERARLVALGVDATAPEVSPEGYVAIRLRDPAGHPIQLFQWDAPRPMASS